MLLPDATSYSAGLIPYNLHTDVGCSQYTVVQVLLPDATSYSAGLMPCNLRTDIVILLGGISSAPFVVGCPSPTISSVSIVLLGLSVESRLNLGFL